MNAFRRMSLAVGATTTKATTATKTAATEEADVEPQETQKHESAHAQSGLFESVDFVPPAHTTCYKLWVVCCSVWIMLFIPLSLTAFAMGLRPMRPPTPPHLTTDPIWLSSENQPVCQEQFPGHKAATGTVNKRASSILCIFNTSTHLRPYVSRMVLGYIPGLICKHVLYASITMPDPEGDLKSSTPEFDMECGGLVSVKILKKRFQHIKVYTVLSANTPTLETTLFTLASGGLDKLAKLLHEWVVKFSFDGVFVSWSQPYAPDKSRVVFGKLADTFRPKYTLGAILPWMKAELQNYDTVYVALKVDWIILKTHGFYPRAGYNIASCPSPFESTDKRTTITNVLGDFVDNMGTHLNLSRVCFSVSFRGTGYKTDAKVISSNMKVLGPGNLNRFTGDDGVIAYKQVCKFESSSTRINAVNQTLVAYEDPRSVSEKVIGTLDFLRKRHGNVPVDQGFCVGVWDLDLDDYKASCIPKKTWPLLEALASVLP
ncbi:hypothetical protein HPB52_009562 [Rhipicephalus sanguineus]|uniref:GH18 domain-containing protein n=1 Tax=Rhipicephalus sanguineus TaxID=34632 RepID=A0A9D4SSB2_RHISA|nr:hypothetical protein HPB52_009562 [Rhipicephalus sanguineus]